MKFPSLVRGPALSLDNMKQRLGEIAASITRSRDEVETLKQKRANMPFATADEIEAVSRDLRAKQDEVTALLAQQNSGDIKYQEALADDYINRSGPALRAVIVEKAGQLLSHLTEVERLSKELRADRIQMKEIGRPSTEKLPEPVTAAVKAVRAEYTPTGGGPQGVETTRAFVELNDFVQEGLLHIGVGFSNSAVARVLAKISSEASPHRERGAA